MQKPLCFLQYLLNRNALWWYSDIVAEALLATWLASQVCIYISARFFPQWHSTRAEPDAQVLDMAQSLLGYETEGCFWDRICAYWTELDNPVCRNESFVPLPPSDADSSIGFTGVCTALSATGILILSLECFAFVNRYWRPPRANNKHVVWFHKFIPIWPPLNKSSAVPGSVPNKPSPGTAVVACSFITTMLLGIQIIVDDPVNDESAQAKSDPSANAPQQEKRMPSSRIHFFMSAALLYLGSCGMVMNMIAIVGTAFPLVLPGSVSSTHSVNQSANKTVLNYQAAKLSYWMNIRTFLNGTDPADYGIADVPAATGILFSVWTGTLTVVSLIPYTAAAIYVICLYINCFCEPCSKKNSAARSAASASVSTQDDDECCCEPLISGMYYAGSMLAMFALLTILPQTIMEFFLPERYQFPGILLLLSILTLWLYYQFVRSVRKCCTTQNKAKRSEVQADDVEACLTGAHCTTNS
ncbi:uncharacterized protein LOC129593077 isoform X2 [Paramacrobiotus metropolitanus]|uniref:uncharacterized protein LOC129593077 isoform X2 n=1 Tax=Paramacrobiotus metropolitanus TaxID=2943436 RepID=UPI002445D1F5|nr:uncharacterized protein LOC129593077 isoform X2 [Paramacrobiotus metropolitanus]